MTSSGYYGEVNLIYSKPKPNKVKIGQLWWHKDMTFSPPYHVSVTKKEHGIDAAKHNSEN